MQIAICDDEKNIRELIGDKVKTQFPEAAIDFYSSGDELLLSDILGTDEDVIYKDLENEAERKMLLKAVGKLSEREKTIICLRFGLGNGSDRELTQKEVANLLGISQSYISRLEKRIISRLKIEISKLID